jgi:hypothetical protein
MTPEDSSDDRDAAKGERKPYSPPKLVVYGDVRLLTRSGATSKSEGSPTFKKTTTSDRRLKENIIPVGTHATGVPLYLFHYRAEFRDALGHGAHLGVMADEVEAVMPEAVGRDASGYQHVDYDLLDALVAPEARR